MNRTQLIQCRIYALWKEQSINRIHRYNRTELKQYGMYVLWKEQV